MLTKHKISASPKHSRYKHLLEATIICALYAMITASISIAGSAINPDAAPVKAGFIDLRRASHGTASVSVGATVTFRKYTVIKILDQYFAVQADLPPGGSYTEQGRGKTRLIIIY